MRSGLYRSHVSQPCDRHKIKKSGYVFYVFRNYQVSSGPECLRLQDRGDGGRHGYYDGVGGTTSRASAYDLARVTDTPVILIVNSKGMSVSLAAYVKGFLEYKKDSRIRGVILNQMSPMLYPRMKDLLEKETGIPVLGYVPKTEDCVIESRHLGLVLPDEIPKLKDNLRKLAEILEKTLDIDGIIRLADSAPGLDVETEDPAKVYSGSGECENRSFPECFRLEKPVRIGWRGMNPSAFFMKITSAFSGKWERS